ncbi:MAG: hypothetical protein BAJATHORv1_20449 [Candidatus Thorarchaeota archaeon]|nr:MAG: hypothetical protein BAJATHORv1_20449 [Candidatus Thorarchaeota archaeon]
MKISDWKRLDLLDSIEREHVRKIWAISFLISIIYLLIGYFFPLIGLTTIFAIHSKLFIEFLIYSIPISLSIGYAYLSVLDEEIISTFDDVYQIIQIGDSYVMTECFEILTVSNRREISGDTVPEYKTSMLLALRAGMENNVNMAFETGVRKGTPFIRLFISAKGKDKDQLKKTLRKEAIRSEAIIVSSSEGANLRQLTGTELKQALTRFSDITKTEDAPNQKLLLVHGSPRIEPSLSSTQIGNFLSTILKQQYSICMTTVFSKTDSSKEKRKLESKYKRIRSKEKTKEDSLSDYAEKQRLLEQYEKVQSNAGWFDTTTYILFEEQTPNEDSLQQAVKGIVLSIWGGPQEITVSDKRIGTRTKIQLISRRHIKKSRLHVNELAAFVNFPIQPLPVISSVPKPAFSLPGKEVVDNELKIGEMIFDDRLISEVGLKIDWLREHLAVLGATGTGKTTLVRKLIHELSIKTNIPWWIFDVKGSEYDDLAECDSEGVVIRPGLDETFTMHLLNPDNKDREQDAHTTFVILRELLRERSSSSELSPAMERMLRDSIMELSNKDDSKKSVQALVEIIEERGNKDRTSSLTRDALLNRLEILIREPLGSILSGDKNSVDIEKLLEKRVVFDLRYVARKGGMDAARLLYNLVAKKIFDMSMKRGISQGLHHIVVLEEASNLVPESYTRSSAADVTTGESMVLLQRATGQGVIVISTRPNISSNILANTATKIAFRLPYDSSIGGRFLALDEVQEKYLRTIKRGRALTVFPGTDAFEIATHPFSSQMVRIEDAAIRDKPESKIETYHYEPEEKIEHEIPATYDRFGNVTNHLIAYLASKKTATEQDLISYILDFDIDIDDNDLREIIWELVSLGTIERESLSLVEGGFIYCLPNAGNESVKATILEYIISKIESDKEPMIKDTAGNHPDLIIGERGVIIFPEHIKASELDYMLEETKKIIRNAIESITEFFVVVRGSVAAAELRELIDTDEELEYVQIIPAFPTSLDMMIKSLSQETTTDIIKIDQKSSQSVPHLEDSHIFAPENEEGINKDTQLKIWIDLLIQFVDLSSGHIGWEHLLEFIETTAIQSQHKKSMPLDIEIGRKCLKELLADEKLVAVRVGDYSKIGELSSGLWVLNQDQIEIIRQILIKELQSKLSKTSSGITGINHNLFHLCSGSTAYLVLPSQKQLTDLLQRQVEMKCEMCDTTKVVCIVAASEYIDDAFYELRHINIQTIEESISVLT